MKERFKRGKYIKLPYAEYNCWRYFILFLTCGLNTGMMFYNGIVFILNGIYTIYPYIATVFKFIFECCYIVYEFIRYKLWQGFFKMKIKFLISFIFRILFNLLSVPFYFRTNNYYSVVCGIIVDRGDKPYMLKVDIPDVNGLLEVEAKCGNIFPQTVKVGDPVTIKQKNDNYWWFKL